MGTVAIIGGGPSGLVAAKTAKECGLRPVIFEKNSSIGGVWQPTQGSTWDSLRTNISHYTCMFSDFAWKQPASDYPNQQEVFNYLSDYMKEFDLKQHLRLNANVQKVSKFGTQWKVEWCDADMKEARIFDFVIVASGFFSTPVIPSLAGKDSFKGRITHSKDYKNPESFRGKNVVIVGNSFSGCEIAAEVSSTASRTIHVASKLIWILPRYLDGKKANQKLPGDLVFYSRVAHFDSQGMLTNELNQRKNRWFNSICTQQQQCPELTVQSNFEDPPFTAISDSYVENVKSKRIEFKNIGLECLREDTVLFKDGSSVKADEIIFCTGFKPHLSFLNQEVLNAMSYLPDDQFMPLLLHKTVFPKDHPRLAFVGMYRGPFLGAMELQARYACMAFSGRIPLPTQQEIEAGVAQEKKIRELEPRPQFPHGNYVGFCEDLAQQIGVTPDLKTLGQTKPSLHKQLVEGPFTVASYRLSGFGSKPQLALRMIEQINKITDV